MSPPRVLPTLLRSLGPRAGNRLIGANSPRVTAPRRAGSAACAGVLVAAMVMAVAPMARADAMATAPVRPGITWSSTLALAQLSDLPARLQQPFSEPLDLSKQGATAQARDCPALLALRQQGFQSANDRALALESLEGARCLSLSRLQQARPARRGSLARFRLSANNLAALPPTLAASFSQIESAQQRAAEQRGHSLASVEAGLNARMDGEALVVTGATWTARIEVLARADLNHDGTDDVLVAVNHTATQGSYDQTRLFLLSTRPGQATLRTVEQLQ